MARFVGQAQLRERRTPPRTPGRRARSAASARSHRGTTMARCATGIRNCRSRSARSRRTGPEPPPPANRQEEAGASRNFDKAPVIARSVLHPLLVQRLHGAAASPPAASRSPRWPPRSRRPAASTDARADRAHFSLTRAAIVDPSAATNQAGSPMPVDEDDGGGASLSPLASRYRRCERHRRRCSTAGSC